MAAARPDSPSHNEIALFNESMRHSKHGVYAESTPREFTKCLKLHNPDMKDKKPNPASYDRLLTAFRELKLADSETDMRTYLHLKGLSFSNAVTCNWRRRGISKEGILAICPVIGIRPAWLENNEGEMLDVPLHKNQKPDDEKDYKVAKDAASGSRQYEALTGNIKQLINIAQQLNESRLKLVIEHAKVILSEQVGADQNSTSLTGT